MQGIFLFPEGPNEPIHLLGKSGATFLRKESFGKRPST